MDANKREFCSQYEIFDEFLVSLTFKSSVFRQKTKVIRVYWRLSLLRIWAMRSLHPLWVYVRQ